MAFLSRWIPSMKALLSIPPEGFASHKLRVSSSILAYGARER